MAKAFTQNNRPMAISTPLGPDELLLVGFSGQEGLSKLFNFQLSVETETATKVLFESLLGKSITVRLDDARRNRRFINGICNRIAQGSSDAVFTNYQLDIVPKFWFLSRQARSRIFQRETVPQILRKVLVGMDVNFELRGTYQPRDYCVQYRETDYNFASRLMEEEGIYYFYKHSDGKHVLVVADTPASHSPLPGGPIVTFQANESIASRDSGRITSWVKRQEIRSGKYTLRDHSFELAHNPLEATQNIQTTVAVGQVLHQLTAGGNGQMELYDWPGEYAQRFDGVDRGGGDQPAELQKIFDDKDRTVGLRMQLETIPAVVIQGAGDNPHLVSGHLFTLATLPGDDTAKLMRAEGNYVLTSVTHMASQGDFRSGGTGFFYQNNFTAIPAGIPFRPLRDTPKPFVQGVQSAVVVGPKGQEIFTDKFGRIKVQFHWDREGKNDADSSCWVRVAQSWAGNRWGASFWPRIGQEVIVAFHEGDPDQPIIVGSVYNSGQMPPYVGDGPDSKHKTDNKLCGVKSNSTPGGVGFNEWRFDDTKGKEQVFIHAERDNDLRVKNDRRERILHDTHLIVGTEKDGKKAGDQRELVFKDRHQAVHGNHSEHIEGNVEYLVGHGGGDGGNVDIVIEKDKKELIEKNSHLHIKANQMMAIDGTQSLTIGKDLKELVKGTANRLVEGDVYEEVAGNHLLIVDGKHHAVVKEHHVYGESSVFVLSKKIVLTAESQISLSVGGNFIDISSTGVSINGTKVLINSGGSPASEGDVEGQSPSPPDMPQDAKQAKPTKPDEADNAVTGVKSAPN